MGIFGIAFICGHKLALHVFVALRSALVQPNGVSIKLKVLMGFAVLSDVCLIVSILCGISQLETHQHDGVCIEHVSMTIYVWLAINDFVIGTFCLAVFVVPLVKLIRVEANCVLVKDTAFRDLTIKIVFWTVIAIASTMTTTGIMFVFSHSMDALIRMDSVINSVCVVMTYQTSNILHRCDGRRAEVIEVQLQSVVVANGQNEPVTETQTELSTETRKEKGVAGGQIEEEEKEEEE